MSWPAVRGATAYNVYACDVDVGVYERVNEAPVDAPAFDCLEVLPYFTYFFKVSAVLSGGESPLSRSAIGWVSPSELRVDAVDGGLALSWASVPGAGLYLLEAAASSDGPFYQLTEAENSLVVADGSYPYDTSCFAFAFDPAAPRQSVRLRAPASDTWFRVRAVQVVDGVSIRSRGGAVEWRKP